MECGICNKIPYRVKRKRVVLTIKNIIFGRIAEEEKNEYWHKDRNRTLIACSW